MTSSAHGLRVEHRGAAALGVGERRPRLSWRLPLGATRQEAYALEFDGRDLGRVEGDASVLVPWPLPTADLETAGGVAGQGLDRGRGECVVDAGLVRDGTAPVGRLGARWIEPFETERSAHVLRHEFRLGGSVRPRGCTPPRTASTRPSSTAAASATSSWHRASPATPTRCTCRSTTSATSS